MTDELAKVVTDGSTAWRKTACILCSFDCDFLAGTPWHKHVPARVERVG